VKWCLGGEKSILEEKTLGASETLCGRKTEAKTADRLWLLVIRSGNQKGRETLRERTGKVMGKLPAKRKKSWRESSITERDGQRGLVQSTATRARQVAYGMSLVREFASGERLCEGGAC